MKKKRYSDIEAGTVGSDGEWGEKETLDESLDDFLSNPPDYPDPPKPLLPVSPETFKVIRDFVR